VTIEAADLAGRSDELSTTAEQIECAKQMDELAAAQFLPDGTLIVAGGALADKAAVAAHGEIAAVGSVLDGNCWEEFEKFRAGMEARAEAHTRRPQKTMRFPILM
jgi:hypothetical protein